jgi:hypothetical protein
LNRNSFMSIDDSVTRLWWQESRQDRPGEAPQPRAPWGPADLAYATPAKSAAHGERSWPAQVENACFFMELTLWRGCC